MTEEGDVDLEDGELMSSDEEGDSDIKKESPVEVETRTSSPKPITSEQTHQTSLTTQSSIEPVSDDGEIYSDNEESAYFPQQVKSRPPPKRQTQDDLPQRKRVSRWSDAYTSSPTRSSGNENNNRSHTPEKRRKTTHSDSPDQEAYFEERDNSNERRPSRDRARRRSSPIRRRDSPTRSGDRHSSPESRRSYDRNQDRNQDRSSPGPQRQKWSHRGGYGSSSPYQSKGHSRYGRGRGDGGNKRLQNLSAKESRVLSQQVPQRLEKGLSLLPDPKYGRNTRVDLSMYPPPATWYLRELKAWDTLHKPKKLAAPPQQISTEPSLPVTSFPASVNNCSFQPTAVNLGSFLAPMAPLPMPLMSSLVNIDPTDPNPIHPPIVSCIDTEARNEHTNYDVDTTPLDPSMPFAQPLPSSNTPFAQHLISSFPTQPLIATDSLSEQPSPPVRTNHDSAKVFLVPGFSNEPQTEIENNTSAQDVSNVTGSDMDSSLLGRTLSVSSEVAMEIDWKTDSQCGTPGLPTPSSPIFIPPKPITPTLPSPPTQPHSSHTPTENAPPPVFNTTSQAPEIPLHSTNDETLQNPASSHSTFVTSSSVVQSLVSPCNSKEEAEPITYNLRSKTDSEIMDSEEQEQRKYSPEVMDISDEEIDYDTYLDQLDDDEVPISATITSSLVLSSLLQDTLPKLGGEEIDPFSEDFPVINRASAPEISSGGDSLMALVGAEVVKEQGPVIRHSGLQSSKKKEKKLTWRAKQRQRQVAAKQAPLQKPPRPPCKYFMNGICKNGDSCTFSHVGIRTKKKEVCKFYKQDTCNKGQDCMYYHEEFPCMFYHLWKYCRNGDNCKFSHSPLNADTEALLATVVDCVSPPSTMPTPPTPHPLMPNERMRINEDGIQVNMFGQNEGFVPMPKDSTDEMTVSIPLTKVKMKTKLGRIPKKSTAPPTSMAPPSWDSNAPTPAPLFPGSLGDHTKGQAQNSPKRVLLPTPPLHAKLTPEDFKQMENMPHEYWEAPHLSETPPQPHPPGGPERRPSIEPSYRPQPPFPPRQKQPFYRPPVPPRPAPPEQSWKQPPHQWPGKMESGPPNSNRPPPDVGPGAWNQNAPPRPDQNTSGGYPRPAGMDHRPSGIDPRSSGMDPRPGGMDPRPSGMDPRPSGMDPRPSGMDHHRPSGMDHHRPGGMDPRPSGMDHHRPSGMDPRPSGMDPRHTGNDPRHSTINNPRFSAHSDPRNSPSQPHHGPGTKWGQPTNIEQRQMQSSPPYAGQHGMSPPLSIDKLGWSDKMSPNWKKPDRVSPAWGTNPDPRYSSNDPRFSAQNNPRNSPSQPYHGPGAKWGQSTNVGQMQSSPPYAGQHGMSPPDKLDKISPNWKPASWGTSPDHQSSTGKGVGDTKRLDPRKKYSHLKIKSKNSPNESTELTSAPSYKIPKLLSDSTGLDKPIDPNELFGSDGGGMDSQPYGEITFGTYKSPFSQNSETNENTPSETAASNHKTISNTQTATDEIKPTGQEVAVPSYFAQMESELGGAGLEIESAFSSLPEKGKEEESKGQESQARKLPSVFGFGL